MQDTHKNRIEIEQLYEHHRSQVVDIVHTFHLMYPILK